MRHNNIVFLLILNLFQFIGSMEDYESYKTSLHSFEYFEKLDFEIKLIIFMYYIPFEGETKLDRINTSYDKINTSYKALKSLSQVCKSFKSLEKLLMNNYRDTLKNILAKFSIEPDFSIFHSILIEPFFNLNQEYNAKCLLDWVSKKSPEILKSVFIVLRLQEVNTDHSEQFIMQEVWSKFNVKDIPLLHLSSKEGNLDLVKYLLHPKITAYFKIDINELSKNRYTALMTACCCPREKRNLEIIKLLLDSGIDISIKSGNKRPMRLEKRQIIKVKSNCLEQLIEDIPCYPPREYSASDLAKKYKYLEACRLIEEHANTMNTNVIHISQL